MITELFPGHWHIFVWTKWKCNYQVILDISCSSEEI